MTKDSTSIVETRWNRSLKRTSTAPPHRERTD